MNGPNAEAITIKDVAIALTSPRYFVPKYSGQKVPLKELLMPCIIPNKLNGITKKIGSFKKIIDKKPSDTIAASGTMTGTAIGNQP